ncbi:cytochrome c oxidase subunit 1 [Apophysomyces sp. BC1034]|nr:cytochrome c oxidase subunit 1 [Apophysomyces sp. BC1034]
MATKKPTTKTSAKPVAKKAAATKAPAKKAPTKKAAAANGVAAPIKETFTKASLGAHIAERAQVEPKAAKAVLAALEQTVLGAVHKKGAGEFTLPGLLKLTVQAVPAKKRRFGKDPFTGEERWFDAKPATAQACATRVPRLRGARVTADAATGGPCAGYGIFLSREQAPRRPAEHIGLSADL